MGVAAALDLDHSFYCKVSWRFRENYSGGGKSSRASCVPAVLGTLLGIRWREIIELRQAARTSRCRMKDQPLVFVNAVVYYLENVQHLVYSRSDQRSQLSSSCSLPVKSSNRVWIIYLIAYLCIPFHFFIIFINLFTLLYLYFYTFKISSYDLLLMLFCTLHVFCFRQWFTVY